MSWETIRTQYLQKMESAEVLGAKAQDLGSLLGTALPAELRQDLEQLLSLTRRQLTKLRNNQFHVAVLGLEKAGKSTLINAWLGVEILPSADERCTYTTTEIRSAPNRDEQFYEVEYLDRATFERDLAEKEQTLRTLAEKQRTIQRHLPGNDYQGLRDDIEETHRLLPRIQSLLGKRAEARRFQEVTEIRDELRRIIADPAHARAVRRIVLHTVALQAARDTVFHDVPGFNSPVEMHRRQAEKRIAECDALIFAKYLLNPSNEGSEVRMLKLAIDEDPNIHLEDKSFVALTKIDVANTPEHYQQLLDKAYQEWAGFKKERIVPVCPMASLFEKGTGGMEVMRDGKTAVERLRNLGLRDGIEQLREAVRNYLDHARADVLAQRCEAILDNLRKACQRLLALVAQLHPELSGDLKAAARQRFVIAFNSWWAKEWKRIQSDFDKVYSAKEDAQSTQFQEFQNHYRHLASSFPATLAEASPEVLRDRYKVLSRGDDGREEPLRAHTHMRKELSEAAMQRIYKLGLELSGDLIGTIGELVDDAVRLLWGLEQVRTELMAHPEQIQARVEHGLSTLFLRFARPAVNIFLKNPRATHDRQRARTAYARDIKVLSEFYEGADRSHGNLDGYLALGSWSPGSGASPQQPSATSPGARAVAPAANTGKAWIKWEASEPKAAPGAEVVSGALETLTAPTPEPAGDQESVISEIAEDLATLSDYLENSVFFASGFQAYWRQELDRIRNAFLELESNTGRWSACVQTACERGHPALLRAAPELGQNKEHLRLVARAAAELQRAMAEPHTSASSASSGRSTSASR